MGDRNVLTTGAARSRIRSRPRLTYEIGYAAIVMLAVVLVLLPVLVRSGFPLNQGTAAPLLLVQIYAAHFRHLDFFPVWSSSDGIGLGTPILLYYHRLFFYVAGLIYVVAGHGLKQSVELTLAIFLVVGAYGMRRAIGVVTESKLLCVTGSIGFLFTNYAFTDWLDPRGDLAEFSALMLVPWLLYWSLNLVKHGRVSYSLIPVVVLLVNAHSAIALLSLFTVAIALVVFVVGAGITGLRAVLWRLIVCFVVTTLLVAPLLIAEFRFSGAYDPANKNKAAAPVFFQFIGFGRYLVDGSHRWFASFQVPPVANFVQIDYAIWVPIAAALMVGFVVAARRSGTRRPVGRRRHGARQWVADRAVAVFVSGSLVVYVFLQLKASQFVYRILTPLQVLNFPWRMLGFITPLGLIVVMMLADGLMRQYPNKALWGTAAGAWVGSLVLLSPVVVTGTPSQFASMSKFAAPKTIDYRTFDGYFPTAYDPGLLYAPFLPKVYSPNGDEITAVLALNSLYVRLHESDGGAQSLGAVGCDVLGPKDAALETLVLTFSVSCGGATRLALPVSYNAQSSVFVNGHEVSYSHVPTDPRMIIDVPNSKPEKVVVHLPTLWGTLF